MINTGRSIEGYCLLYALQCFEWKFFVLVYGIGSFSGPGSDLAVAVVTVAALVLVIAGW
jgi:hypothetical protein